MPAVAADPAAQVLETAGLEQLLEEAGTGDRCLHTRKDLAYLRWRYGAAPLLDYRAVVDEAAGRPAGLAVFRVRPRGAAWESTVAEVLAPGGDRRTVRRLLRRVARAASVDHLTVDAAAGTPAAGFLPAPGGIAFVVKPLRDGVIPDPTSLHAWDLSLGDLEVF
jgi:hypothetical protein